MKRIFLTGIATAVGFLVTAQKQDAQFIEYYNHYYHDEIMKKDEASTKASTQFKMDPSDVKHPGEPSSFTTAWCQDPISQGNTGTCWCFSTTSFFEAEVFRLSEKKIDLSELYIVYHEYIHKATEFVRSRGESHFGEGSETNAVMRMMEMYGTVPQSAYAGIPKTNHHHNHASMFNEMNNFLHGLKKSNDWNEEHAISTIKSILNHHIGTPPTSFEFEGKTYTPKQFMTDVCKLEPTSYVEFMSLKEKPYNTKAEYDVPDNWWNSDQYYNAELDDFMKVLNNAVEKGYTVTIGGDVSESGFLPLNDMAYVPEYDIPHKYINEDARQLRFTNESTTDDHAIHLIGYKDTKEGRWYLIKDSGSSARNGKYDGYMMYHESYIKLKIMTFTVHKDAAQDILTKFK